MNEGLLYLDSSALVKLVAREPESEALFAFAAEWPERVSSQLARVEVLRAARRVSAAGALRRRAEEVLARISLVRLDESVLDLATGIEPKDLRTLDAIHLATALSLGAQLRRFVAYDRRLLDAADRAGLSTASPS